jgi:hypothetical protein
MLPDGVSPPLARGRGALVQQRSRPPPYKRRDERNGPERNPEGCQHRRAIAVRTFGRVRLEPFDFVPEIGDHRELTLPCPMPSGSRLGATVTLGPLPPSAPAFHAGSCSGSRCVPQGRRPRRVFCGQTGLFLSRSTTRRGPERSIRVDEGAHLEAARMGHPLHLGFDLGQHRFG